ncbi:cellobiose phosphorylase [Aurantiacibacter marinus]|uniref:Cellobiose phosphorylase n=1 Tax=Aurantiacibacter marinus TaxID=874156 RepID=A0A0H0XLZ2_9SPHN|nr:cellobiose phosphorylase [Aurantiacibacter marinus]
MAERHRIVSGPPQAMPVWSEIGAVRRWLERARRASVDPPPDATKAAEWFLDNDYQVHRAIRQIEQDLPAAFYRRLPALGPDTGPDTGPQTGPVTGPITGPVTGSEPRVAMVARELLIASHLQLTHAIATDFVTAYQRHDYLTIAELWALPTMLRIACIEMLIMAMAELFEDALAQPVEISPRSCESASLEATERVARCITNLATIAAINWNDFFDEVSLVEAALREDPSGAYAAMDFATRDTYRNAVERMASASMRDEVSVAQIAVKRAAAETGHTVEQHIGYWLIDGGRDIFERELGLHLELPVRLQRLVRTYPGWFYAFAIIIAGTGSLLLPAAYLWWMDAAPAQWMLGLAVSLLPASVLAFTAVHWGVTRLLPPSVLPKMDFDNGMPCDAKSAVVVPAMVSSVSDIANLAEQLETHWFANADPRLCVVLLADLPDAESEEMPSDETLREALVQVIRDQNRRHPRTLPEGEQTDQPSGPFHLLLRSRLWNESEGCWMGWERKRGKLEQFNRLLVDDDRSSFSLHEGDPRSLAGIRYVVTVDADTLLPPGSVARLVATLAHPLNHARFDRRTGRVLRGFALLQPRVEISPAAGMRTLFARLFTGDTAIDIYSRAVSDIYQDLFGAGIFVGKGAYDLRAFHASVDGRMPENRILSHDLLEGAHGRAGLATDIVLYENFPATYPEYARRLHRWIRGDWQLLGWLGRRVPGPNGKRLPTRIAGIDRWKMLDNLRRSLVAPGSVAMAMAGWLVLPGSPWFWTFLVAFGPGGQLATDLVSGLARGRRIGASYGLVSRLKDQAGRWLLAMVCLLHEALLSLHAIAVTLWRSFVSHRHLLEWTAAAQVAARHSGETARRAIWREMGPSVLVAAVIACVLLFVRPAALSAGLPLLAVWLVAPEIMLRASQPRQPAVDPLNPEDIRYLRLLARRTWYFFEQFAGPVDNWLPPDNYQGPPHEEIGHRTSPTNIGMLLTSSASAWDLGYLGRIELLARGWNVMETLSRMERYRGHFYNWYETLHLRPLEPRYVSTVDSGNLAVGLIAFAETLREAGTDTALEPQRWEGLRDLIDLMRASASRSENAHELEVVLAQWEALTKSEVPTAEEQARQLDTMLSELPLLEEITELICEHDGGLDPASARDLVGWLERLGDHITDMQRDLSADGDANGEFDALAAEVEALAWSMDFAWLYDRQRKLFFLGYNISTGQIDMHRYDLLASEARLASFFAIAKGDVPLEHWFHLERPVTRAAGGLALLSWNGSMFEYLMPRLLLRSGSNSLLEESERIAVAVQRLQGRANGTPWGVSESAYAERDPEHRYRYQAFGTPGLGLRRGLARHHVIAPYASALALAIAPRQAAANLRAISALGAEGRYGLWEALDFTPERKREDAAFTPVIAYMAHHQGMLLCAIANALTDDVMVARFSRDPQMRLVSLLLSERIPHDLPPELPRLDNLENTGPSTPVAEYHVWTPQLSAYPQALVLGNGRLSSCISDSGGGGLGWHGQALTRFIPDSTRDAEGLWIYIHEEEAEATWSITRQPTGKVADESQIIFSPHCAEFHSRIRQIDHKLEIAIGGGDDIEVRRVSFVNESDRLRKLRVTSYAETVLAPPLEYERHPAFSKLFVSSQFIERLGGLMIRRRPRRPEDTPPVILHYAIDGDGPLDNLSYSADRRAFLGRGGTYSDPRGACEPLDGSIGFTLDPIMALQTEIVLAPGERREMCFITIAGASSSSALEIAARYASLGAVDWLMRDAAIDAAHSAHGARITPDLLPVIQSLASALVYPHSGLRSGQHLLRANEWGQRQLWPMALSGDLPIVLLRVTGVEDRLVEELCGAHKFWRSRGLAVDLVLLQTSGSSYAASFTGELADLLASIGAHDMLGRNGGIHLLFSDQVGAQHVRLLETVAAVVLDDDGRSIAAQLEQGRQTGGRLPPIIPTLPPESQDGNVLDTSEKLLFDNGIGGFSCDGSEYVIRLGPGQTTPAPWINVLANENFGTLVTEAGGGFSWSINSGEQRLTTWTNDPVNDRPSEVLYLRDEESALVWTITPGAARTDAPCEIRHGRGCSTWRTTAQGLEQEQSVWIVPGNPVKIVRLRVRNLSDRARRITATYYAEWLMGSLFGTARRHITCTFDADAQAILAQSHWNAEFAGRAAFLTATVQPHGFTTDRCEFLGREGDLAQPEALSRWGLAGTQATGEDPCGACQIHLDLAAGEMKEIAFILGEGANRDEAAALAKLWREGTKWQGTGVEVAEAWSDLLGRVEVETPDAAFDLMVNNWLIYQSLSSRILARSGFYQASGAYGYRDQLQDMLALLPFDPQRVRAHILECAAHQFEEGDVLHWWHPPAGRGVRTRCSDDLVWLPYAVATYVRATGDLSILEEKVPYLTAPELRADEEDRYSEFERTDQRAPILEHCERALERVDYGRNGLPLIGAGDWNDGMDRVGREGRGESVWLAWFVSLTAAMMADIHRQRNHKAEADFWQARADRLRQNAEDAGWDGDWYRRAFDDAGNPLGSATEEECRIDSISQSWAAFAGADPARVSRALHCAKEELIDDTAGLARLLWPPFDKGPRDPGYIKAYPPGIRENGGQYSHAAAWLGLAFAQQGDGDGALEIFDMLSPVKRVATPEDAETYRTEPYAIAADIGGVEPHRGMGGWSWYTGAAAWTWRLGVEGILGITMRGGGLHIAPALPTAWPGYRATFRRGDAAIVIVVEHVGEDRTFAMSVDGEPCDGAFVEFPGPGKTRKVVMRTRDLAQAGEA